MSLWLITSKKPWPYCILPPVSEPGALLQPGSALCVAQTCIPWLCHLSDDAAPSCGIQHGGNGIGCLLQVLLPGAWPVVAELSQCGGVTSCHVLLFPEGKCVCVCACQFSGDHTLCPVSASSWSCLVLCPFPSPTNKAFVKSLE